MVHRRGRLDDKKTEFPLARACKCFILLAAFCNNSEDLVEEAKAGPATVIIKKKLGGAALNYNGDGIS